MLQRAGSNAYSWGWATHIRTKQSKWLEENLHDMEEKIKETLKIIQNNGDSFAQRVEMYYKKRPELVNLVEEALRAHRALAERYEHISKQLQNAHHTIATVCPDQVQYYMDEDDEESKSEMVFSSSNDNKEMAARPNKVPSISKKEFRSPSMSFSRNGPRKMNASSAVIPCNLEEIDTLQKEIMSLQAEKEFMKGAYENAQEKIWEIESRITEMQRKVYSLQDKFEDGTVIEDNVGSILMENAALSSCQEALCQLQEKQALLSKEGQVEYRRLKEAHEKFEMLRDEFISKHMNNQEFEDWYKSNISESPMDEIVRGEQEQQDPEFSLEKIESNSPLTVIELAEKIDGLANKVISLETTFSSQTASGDTLKSETDELHSKIKTLEADKEMLIEDAENMKIKTRELEEELQRVKNLNHTVRNKNNSLQTESAEASSSLVHISERVQNMKRDGEEADAVSFKKRTPKEKEHKDGDSESLKDDYAEKMEYDGAKMTSFSLGKEEKASDLSKSQNFTSDRGQEDLDESVGSHDMELHALGKGEDQLYRSGLNVREKTLLEEYASVLRNYKEVRVKLDEVETTNRASIFELSSKVRELTGSLAARDKEIEFLHQKMNISGNCPNEEHRKLLNEAADSQESPKVVQKSLAEPTDSSEESGSSNGNNEKSRGSKRSDKKSRVLSPLERKLRTYIDDLLEEDLEFWLRFSTSVHQIKKFETSIHDLRAEILKLRDKIWRRHSKKWTAQSEVRPIYRHLRELQTELALWLEHNSVLEDELKGRLSTLNNVQDEITFHSNRRTDNSELSDYQAAKFQGEVLNMRQENKKRVEELHTGLDHVRELKVEMNDVLRKLEEEFGFGVNSQSQIRPSSNRVPLRSFLFGVKLKRKTASKSSMFP